MRLRLASLVCAAVWTLPACSSVDTVDLARRFAGGDRDGVRAELAQLAESEGSDGHVWLLSRAIADFAAGDVRGAISALRHARDQLDAIRGRSYGNWIESVLADDRAIAYDGADYEHVLTRTCLALFDLASGGGDVVAYLNQMLLRQQELREGFVDEQGNNPKQGCALAVIGNWLLAALDAENATRADVVVRQLQMVLAEERGCEIARRELERYRNEGLCKPGNGVVQVVAMVGLGPGRTARDEPVSSTVLHFAQQIYNAKRDRVAIPSNLIKAVQVPDLVFHSGNPSDVAVTVGGASAVTETVTSVERLARVEFEQMRASVVLRAVLRRIFKLAVAEVLKAELVEKDKKEPNKPDPNDGRKRARETPEQRRKREEEERKQRERDEAAEQIGGLIVDAFALLWIGVEDVDRRCWALLPASFQVARLELPEGEHDVVLRARSNGQVTGDEQRVRVRVRRGRSTFVVALVPSTAGGPPPMSADAVEATPAQ